MRFPLDAEGLTPRNVNKYRQVLQALFAFACRSDTFALPANPVDRTDKRREEPPRALDYYEVEEVEALARVCEQGEHRQTVPVNEEEATARAGEDRKASLCRDGDSVIASSHGADLDQTARG